MELISYIARRVALIIPTLLGASLVMFVLTTLIPGDPALMRLGNFATAEQLQSLREEMGLTKPPYERYALYLGDLLRGDLGRSWRTGNLVLDDLQARLPMSLELGVCSMLLAIALGIPVGVWGVASKDSVVDYNGKAYRILGVAMPPFWGGLVLVYVFYFQVRDRSSPHGPGRHAGVTSQGYHRVIPPRQCAYGRSGGLHVERRASRAAGHHAGLCHGRLDRPHDVYLHAQSPGLTIHSGQPCLWALATGHHLQIRSEKCPHAGGHPDWFAGGFSHWCGVVLVEVVFSLPGIGRYAVESLLVNDFVPVQGFVLLVLIVYLLVNLLVDLLYSVLNPQVRNG